MRHKTRELKLTVSTVWEVNQAALTLANMELPRMIPRI